MKNDTEKKSVEIQPEQIEKLENLYFELCCALKSSSFRPRFALYTGSEKIKVIRKYIRVLDILDIQVPEIDPLIADLLKLYLSPTRNIWASASDRPKSDK